MTSRLAIVMVCLFAFFLAGSLTLGGLALRYELDQNSAIKANTQNIKTLLTNGKSASSIASKEVLTDSQRELILFGTLEQELGTIIVADHLSLNGAQIKCTTNPTNFTISCKYIPAPTSSTTTTTTTVPAK